MSSDQLQFADAIAKAASVLRHEGATEVYVFGSAAEGRARPESDLDLAVVGLPARRFFAAMALACDAAGRTIDLIDLDSQNPFTRYLRRSGELRRVA